jgi:hypothetical protein
VNNRVLDLRGMYKAPRISVRGVFLCENIANVQSPVDRVTLEPWENVDESLVEAETLSFQIF